MLNLKASVAAAVLVGTAVVSAGAGYAISRATLTARLAIACPTPAASASAPLSTRPFPPVGNLPATTGGTKF